MQTVGHLDEHHAYVLTHGEQEFSEIFGLGRGSVSEYTTRNLGESGHNLGNLLAKLMLYVLDRILRVLDHIVQQGRADGCGTETYLTRGNLGHRYGMEYIGLARASPHPVMGRAGKLECPRDYIDLLAVVACKIAVKQIGKLVFYEFVLLLGSEVVCFHGKTYVIQIYIITMILHIMT